MLAQKREFISSSYHMIHTVFRNLPFYEASNMSPLLSKLRNIGFFRTLLNNVITGAVAIVQRYKCAVYIAVQL